MSSVSSNIFRQKDPMRVVSSYLDYRDRIACMSVCQDARTNAGWAAAPIQGAMEPPHKLLALLRDPERARWNTMLGNILKIRLRNYLLLNPDGASTRQIAATDGDLVRIAGACHRLVKLNLYNCNDISHAGVIALQRLPLKSLNLMLCYLVSDEVLSHLPLSLTSIKLSGNRMTDIGMAALRTTSLRRISLWGVGQGLTDAGIMGALPSSLTDLDLGHRPVSGGFLEQLATVPLSGLRITHCMRVGADAPHFAKSLKNLWLDCFPLTDEDLAFLARLTRLEDLTIEYDIGQPNSARSRFKGNGFDHLSPSLKRIALTGCRSLTDRGVMPISRLPHLENLSLRLCTCITDEALSYLAEHKTLKQLDLSLCSALSKEAIDLLRAQLPRTTILSDQK